ncbi:Uncharacterised protein [Moraxella cuniculi]|uniref:Uncharacterized protein n=1 Tax=Moraxella cuniculi TaxID=34061 RepID=A0A448GWG4_9GAMM|nr:Uncharacterised protein [Moraxella cuniculi]
MLVWYFDKTIKDKLNTPAFIMIIEYFGQKEEILLMVFMKSPTPKPCLMNIFCMSFLKWVKSTVNLTLVHGRLGFEDLGIGWWRFFIRPD